MAVKVSYKQGTKATYLGLLERNPYSLYFCTDTKELFKGEDLYTDGIRIVKSYESLPQFLFAADGILYFCEDTGCGYVLNEDRNEWIPVVHGVDNETITLNENGLLSIKEVPVESVIGLAERLTEIEQKIPVGLIGSEEIKVAEDGTLSIGEVEQVKIVGLEDRLHNIEQSIVGGVRYRGAVETFEDLPTDASTGDLYEVYADNSEWCWNGEKWFEYGNTTEIDLSHLATKEEVRTISELVKFEISHKPEGTLVSYSDDEIRVMCPSTTKWEKQNVGATGNSNMYYMGFKAYAPEDAVGFKEGDQGVIIDEYFDFTGDFAGTDEYGRNYSICWLALASYNEETDTWNYFGKNSNAEKYVGWTYVIEWYNADGVVIASDSIRINLSNEDCHNILTPFYVSQLQTALAELEEMCTWGDM